MKFSRSDLADFTYFLAIARHRSFRRAGLELEVSASALSHSLKGLEARLGIRLLNRTNRSVTLTAAGEALLQEIKDPFEAIGRAADGLSRYRDVPAGRIRLNVVGDAAPLLLGPVLLTFVERYPEVELDISATNRMVDVIDQGFDAGIRYGGTVPEDMVAQRLSADIRWTVAASRDYLAKFGVPKHPNELLDHRCLKVRLGDDRIYRWEFEQDGKELAIDVRGTITTDDTRTALPLVAGGVGLMYGPDPAIRPLVDSGTVRFVLEDWAVTGPGYHIYYSSRRHVPVGLKLLIELIREMKPLGL